MKQEGQSLCSSKVFEEVYKTNVTSLRNYIYYKSGDADLAEDIIQDCFMKIWNNCSNIILKTVKPLLYKMAFNSFLNTVSHKKVVLEHQKSFSNNDQTNEDPEFILEEKEFLKKLEKAISNLTDKQREVFLLNRIDKKTYREISELLNISLKAVEKRMSIALKELRKQIKGL